MAHQFPQQFGPYTLHQLIARGGMAEIYRATMPGIGTFEKMVAIKKILPHLVENEEFITMLIDEARILVGLNHANIAQVYDLGAIDDTYYIAMEFVHGLDFASMIKGMAKAGQYLPFEHVAYMTSCLCNGLHGAHSATDQQNRPLNIVHRDISPHNVLVSYGGEVKIIDFGVAKARSKDSSTKAGVIKGKLLYMAPEQAMAQAIDGRSDLFAAGLCMYKMLTHQLPFEGENEFQIYNNILTKDIVPPKLIRPEVPESLNQIVMTLLQREVDKRYQDGYSAKKDLDRALHDISPGYTPSKLSRFVENNFSKEAQAKQQAAPVAPPTPSGFGQERVRTKTPPTATPMPQQQGVQTGAPVGQVNTFGQPQGQPNNMGFGMAPNTPAPPLIPNQNDPFRASAPVGDTGEFGAADNGLPPATKKPVGLIVAVIFMAVLFSGLLVYAAFFHKDEKQVVTPPEVVKNTQPKEVKKVVEPPVTPLKVSIKSDPTGADIKTADGNKLGKTPFEGVIKQAEFPMLLELRLDGHQLGIVKLTRDSLNHTIKLEPKDEAVEDPDAKTDTKTDTKDPADAQNDERGDKKGGDTTSQGSKAEKKTPVKPKTVKKPVVKKPVKKPIIKKTTKKPVNNTKKPKKPKKPKPIKDIQIGW